MSADLEVTEFARRLRAIRSELASIPTVAILDALRMVDGLLADVERP